MPLRSQAPYHWAYNSDFFDDHDFEKINANYFDAEFWRRQNAIVGEERGRGTTYFIAHQGKHLVLRHYLRGGLMGKLVHDHYLFQNTDSTRSLNEFKVLEYLIAQGLPTARPVAAQVKRKGMCYQADIIVERIPNAQDLVKHLQTQAQDEQFYRQLGELVARFHQHGVHHADLNIKNILCDAAGKLWLIDFDKGQLNCHDSDKQLGSLMRLKRSFEKERERHGIHFKDENWQSLEQSYQAAMRTAL